MRSLRVVGLSAIAVPLTVGIVLFLVTWRSSATSGAGLSEENRPIGFILMAAFAAFGWVLGSSAMFSIFLAPRGLPRVAQPCATLIVRGPQYIASFPDGRWRDDPAVTDSDRSISMPRLLGLALVELPLFLFLAPMLLGWLLQGDVYRPPEVASVVVMTFAVTAWSALLVARVRSSGQPTPD